MTYTITTTVDAQFDDAVAEVITALEDEGFGILADIDTQLLLDVAGNLQLEEISADVHERFERVISAVDGQFPSAGEFR